MLISVSRKRYEGCYRRKENLLRLLSHISFHDYTTSLVQDGTTALHVAVRKGHFEMVEVFLYVNVQLNIQDKVG